MAYSNYLLKVGGTILPTSFIKVDTYEVIPDQVMDYNSYRDANGTLHRTTVTNTPSKITFQTKPMNRTQMNTFKGFLSSRVRVTVEFYNPMTDSYQTEYMYIPDTAFHIYTTSSGEPMYKETEISFIGY